MNIRTLIIADIHTHFGKAEKIIKYEAPDKIVFLGDYFDDWHDDSRIAAETAHWLLESLNKPNRIHLMGNHDISYAIPHRSYKCSGYDAAKDYAISDILKEPDWKKLPLFTWIGSWFCSHAGVHPYFYNKYGSGKDYKVWINQTCDDALQRAFAVQPAAPILWAGLSRGGNEIHGGIIWCDREEFQPIPNIKQVFGHTPSVKPVWIDQNNLCLDTRGHCNYYAIHDSQSDAIVTKWIGDM